MTSWIIVLGAAGPLGRAELEALFSSSSFTQLSDSCVLFDPPGGISPQTIQEAAGSVVKIARVVQTMPTIVADKLASVLISLSPDGQKITFGISRYDGDEVRPAFLAEIKDSLEAQGRGARFVQARHGVLSSVVVSKGHVQELVIAKHGDQFVVGATVTVQDFEAWGRRDFGRPYADPKSGMLPPKVARMVVNIALKNSEIFQGKPVQEFTILDPFCGMGTILAEGLLRGARTIGSDISVQVVDRARKNLDWLVKEYPSGAHRYDLFVSDATHVSEHLAPDCVDAIVTEPFMGTTRLGGNDKLHMTHDEVKNTIKGLEKLYIGALRDWAFILKSGGKVVIAIPRYEVGGRTYVVKKVVDNCENLGYSKLLGPIEYSRPKAVVKREFYLFQKK